MLKGPHYKTLPSITWFIAWPLSVQFSRSVVSNTLQPHGLQHTRLPCPPPTPGACSNSCPLSWWCHPTISSSVIPFSSHLQSFPTSESFPVSQFFPSSGQSIGISASASVLPMNIQVWFPLRWTGWIFLQSKGLSRVFSNTTVQKHQFFGIQISFFFFHLFLLVGGKLLYNIVVVFAIYWHESAMDLHVFPIPIPPPASLPIPSLWVFPVHQPGIQISLESNSHIHTWVLKNHSFD